MAIPVLNIEQIRAWENATWESGISQEDVIKKAGAMVAYYAEKMTSPCSLILGIGGKGHNGDDTEQAINQIKNNSADFIRAVIAAKAAQQSQPGLITLITLADSYIPVASQLSAVMVHPWRPSLELPENTTGIVIGPGLASSEIPPGLVDFVVKLWDQFPGPVCVDASALDWLPEKSISSKAPRIITPHPGEAARMLKTTTQKVLSNRFETVRSLSKRFGNTWVVLKGHQSLIGNFNGIIYVNSTGNPWLAQGGAGDALAGFLGGLIAQPQLQSDILKTIRYAVWKHGLTADYMQSIKTGWTIEELTQHLGKKFTDNEFILKVC